MKKKESVPVLQIGVNLSTVMEARATIMDILTSSAEQETK